MVDLLHMSTTTKNELSTVTLNGVIFKNVIYPDLQDTAKSTVGGSIWECAVAAPG